MSQKKKKNSQNFFYLRSSYFIVDAVNLLLGVSLCGGFLLLLFLHIWIVIAAILCEIPIFMSALLINANASASIIIGCFVSMSVFVSLCKQSTTLVVLMMYGKRTFGPNCETETVTEQKCYY